MSEMDGARVDPSRPLVISDLFTLADDPALPWKPFATDIAIYPLYQLPSGQAAALLKYSAGANLRRHRHVGIEHILVLRGAQSDDNGLHPRGTLLVHPAGTSHAVQSADGCIVLAIWERPVVFDGEAPESEVERL